MMFRLRISPHGMRRFNAGSMVLWLVVTPLSVIAGWSSSVTFVTVLSTWALFSASLSGYVASRVEVAQAEQDIAADVVEAIVVHTTVDHLDAT